MNAIEKVAVGYDIDFHEWLRHQANLLRERRFEELDLAHLIQEIESLGNEQLHAVESFITQILAHLAYLRYSPSQLPRSHWQAEIAGFRAEIDRRFKTSPSLRRKATERFDDQWRYARRRVVLKLAADGVRPQDVPAECPFTWAQVLDEDFFVQGEL